MLDNADPRLSAAWHAVLPGAELGADPSVVPLLGVSWILERSNQTVTATAADGRSAAAVAEKYGMIWVAVSTPAQCLPELIEMNDAEFATTVISRHTHVSAGVLVDNFLDVSHFSYLHRDGWVVRLSHATDLHEGTATSTSRSDPSSWRVATYSVLAPYVVHLQMEFPAIGEKSAAALLCRPDADGSTTVYVVVAWRADDPVGLHAQADLSATVLEEDLRLLERMADPRLELSLRAELHTKADRACVEYRRLISDYLDLGSGHVRPDRHDNDGEVMSLATRS